LAHEPFFALLHLLWLTPTSKEFDQSQAWAILRFDVIGPFGYRTLNSSPAVPMSRRKRTKEANFPHFGRNTTIFLLLFPGSPFRTYYRLVFMHS
jgi:hypothetical protein